MSFLAAITEKPWLNVGEALTGSAPAGQLAVNSRRSGLRMFLGIVGILFSLMVVAYGGRMLYPDWRPGPQIKLLWGNTAILLASSLAMQWALIAARRGLRDAMRIALLACSLFTLIFLFGQLMAWRQLAQIVLGNFSNPAVGFFYMITGIHGLHMVGGLVALSRTSMRAFGDTDSRQLANSIGNCALYWHFLLGVWLVLFGLLFSGDNFELLLQICGIK